jgi:hypothetical protein
MMVPNWLRRNRRCWRNVQTVQNAEGNHLADDKNEHDVWWNNYLTQVNASVAAAEQHLEVRTGTISSIPNDVDFIAIVKMYAVIEPILNDLIASWQPQTPHVVGGLGGIPSPLSDLGQAARENFRAFVTALNIGGRTGKLQLVEGLGLLAQHQIAFILAVVQIRNRYAHNVKNIHRSLADIVTEEQRNNGRIVEHLTGINLAGGPPSNALLKLLMYYRLADYLSDALHTLRPPPLPQSMGGILAGLGQLAASAEIPKA